MTPILDLSVFPIAVVYQECLGHSSMGKGGSEARNLPTLQPRPISNALPPPTPVFSDVST